MLENNHNNKKHELKQICIRFFINIMLPNFRNSRTVNSNTKLKPDFIKEHYKAREIQIDTYPGPFISTSADPCFLIRPGNAKAFSAE